MARNLRSLQVEDRDGEEWHRVARGRWDEAVAKAGGGKPPGWDQPDLPDFRGGTPVHVTREIFGRFLQDRDTGIVHDCYNAQPDCRLDEIRNGTFFHFWSEVLEVVGEDVPCDLCMA